MYHQKVLFIKSTTKLVFAKYILLTLTETSTLSSKMWVRKNIDRLQSFVDLQSNGFDRAMDTSLCNEKVNFRSIFTDD